MAVVGSGRRLAGYRWARRRGMSGLVSGGRRGLVRRRRRLLDLGSGGRRGPSLPGVLGSDARRDPRRGWGWLRLVNGGRRGLVLRRGQRLDLGSGGRRDLWV
jgi:hypothetical protein